MTAPSHWLRLYALLRRAVQPACRLVAVLLGLWLMGSVAMAQQAGPLPSLLAYQVGDAVTDQRLGVRVELNEAAIATAAPGDQFEFLAPNGLRYVFVTDSVAGTKTGNVHWVAHLLGGGSALRALLSYGNGAAFGSLATADGNFRLDTVDAQARLLDLNASGRKRQPFDEAPLLPPARAGQHASAQSIASPLTQTGPVTIDLMVLYTNGLASKLGADAVQTRIENLVAQANQAYVDSRVNLQLRLVHSAQVNASDHVTHVSALSDLAGGIAPFDKVAALRSAYGADLVALLKQWDTSADGSVCGLGYLLGAEGVHMDAGYAFSAVSTGDDIAGTSGYCSDFTLAHELGHNMGSVHDRAHTNGAGAYRYSYGYGISGKFGDIMSYISPEVGKFSNPALVCDSANDPCGVSELDLANGANNALSLNNTAATVAAFNAATGLDTTPNHFSFTRLSGVNGGDVLLSEAIVVGGLSTAADISISGGEYSVDGAAFTSASGSVSNGQSLQVRLTASTTPYALSAAMLTVGTLSRAFRVSTRPAVIANAAALAVGADHALALRSDGSVWSWGDNASGQLGDASRVGHALPAQVAGVSGVTAISAASDYSLALKADATVWGWGAGNYGQLGSAGAASNATPIRVAGLSQISQIAAGFAGALAIDSSGAVWVWGGNAPVPVKLAGLAGANALAAGGSHQMVLLGDGSLRVWGDNSTGQLGLGAAGYQTAPVLLPNLSNVIAISAGAGHSLALRADGTVWAWGDNSYGQIGDGTLLQRNTPVAVSGVGGSGTLGGVVAIAAGQYHSMAIRTDGSLVAWGLNGIGQLGDGSTQDSPTPVASLLTDVSLVSGGLNGSFALTRDGAVWGWGNNDLGQVGDGTTTWRISAVPVGGATPWLIGAGDMEPAPLSLGASNGLAGSTVVSSALKVSGINQATAISIVGGEYSLDGGAYTSLAGLVNPGQSVTVRLTAPATAAATASAVLTVGGVATRFTVTAVLAPGAPSTVLATAGDGQATVSFAAPTSNGGSAVTGYTVTSSPAGGVDNDAGTLALSHTVTGLGNGIAYTFYVTATNAVGSSAPSASSASVTPKAAGAAATVSLDLSSGWNLLGNSLEQPISVTALFGDTTLVNTVWKWDRSAVGWQFYSPQMDAAALLNYATNKGYGVLGAINPGEGYWVNAKHAGSLGTRSGTGYSLGVTGLLAGWNLLATVDDVSPSVFNRSLSGAAAGQGAVPINLTSLWAWDSSQLNWYFYSPNLEASGGLSAYIATKGYLDFATQGKTLGNGVGFWVNRP